MLLNELTYLQGKPTVTADIRTENADFIVQEMLPFQPSGEGEHHLLHLRKNGLNTVQVAGMLAKFAKVHPKEVTFAGQKDKHAITEQWFGIRIPGKETPDWQQLNSEQVTILSQGRHGKKLRTGALSGNRFTLKLRQVSDMGMLLTRVAQVIKQGVPNYFGEQRFGHDGRNLVEARAMFAGRRIKDRNKRSIYLSAIRSNIFNLQVSTRLAKGLAPIDGDCVQLSGSRSYFTVEHWDQEHLRRLEGKDILFSAPLWGRGELNSTGQAQALETDTIAKFELAADCQGLEQAGLEQERRALLLYPEQFTTKVHDETSVTLSFILPAGSFATSVLRELCDYTDVQEARFQAYVAEKQAQEALAAETLASESVTSETQSTEAKTSATPKTPTRLKLLVSNDDGVHAAGIKALAEALAELGEVKVVAPDRNCSGASNSLTLTNPLRIQQHDNGYTSVNGTPTDCVHLAIRELYQEDEPAIVVSGINAGANLGDDTLYSGTVAAAMEGRFLGLPAIAISLVGKELKHYQSAAFYAAKIVTGLLAHPIAADQILNVNVPDLPLEAIKGIQVTRLGARHKAEAMIKTQDPAGRDIYWLGPPGEQQDAGTGTDFGAVNAGYVSITPLTVDLTAYRQIKALESWVLKI